MSFKLFLLLLFLSIVAVASKSSLITLRGFRCTVSEEFVYQNFSCYLRRSGKNSADLNVYMMMKEPLYEFNYAGVVKYKSGSVYHEIMKFPPVEVCGIIKTGQSNLALYQLYKVLEAGYPGAVHSCPYTEVNIQNFTLQPDLLISSFPSGDLKLDTMITTGEGESITNYSVVARFTQV